MAPSLKYLMLSAIIWTLTAESNWCQKIHRTILKMNFSTYYAMSQNSKNCEILPKIINPLVGTNADVCCSIQNNLDWPKIIWTYKRTRQKSYQILLLFHQQFYHVNLPVNFAFCRILSVEFCVFDCLSIVWP